MVIATGCAKNAGLVVLFPFGRKQGEDKAKAGGTLGHYLRGYGPARAIVNCLAVSIAGLQYY